MFKKLIMTETQFNRLKGILLEFTANEFKKVFVVGNTVTFFIKTGEDIAPIEVKIIEPTTDTIPKFERPNQLFGQVTGEFPIDLRNKILAIDNETQNIKNGIFKYTIIGNFVGGKITPLKDDKYIERKFNNLYKVDVKNASGGDIGLFYVDETDRVKDKELANKEDEKSVSGSTETIGDDEEKRKKELADAKKTLDAILADPNLKKAFYSQPSLWELFKAELTGKKATGKGIITVKNIYNAYEGKKATESVKKTYKPGNVEYIFNNKEPIVIGYLTIKPNLKDIGVLTKETTKYGQSIIKSYATNNSVKSTYTLTLNKDLGDNTYSCTVAIKSKGEMLQQSDVNVKLLPTKQTK